MSPDEPGVAGVPPPEGSLPGQRQAGRRGDAGLPAPPDGLFDVQPEPGRSAGRARIGGSRGRSVERRSRRPADRQGKGRRSEPGQTGDEPAPGHPEDFPGDPESVARAICLRLLTGRPRTRAELAAALAGRGVPAEAAEAVLGRFAEVGLIDDRAFAEAWVGSRHAGRGLGRRALAAELRRRGVDGSTVGEAVVTLDPATEERTARELVARRLAATRRLDPPVRLRRLVGLLARKGYPPGLAFRVVREELAAEGADPGELADLDGSPDDW